MLASMVQPILQCRCRRRLRWPDAEGAAVSCAGRQLLRPGTDGIIAVFAGPATRARAILGMESTAMRAPSALLAQAFAAIGHFYVHLFTAFYFVIVLALQAEWRLGYGELLSLWTLGSLLMGAGALPAGWLGDRWSARGMMAVFFIGIGLSSIACGLVRTPTQLMVCLAAVGLFASIYHPVGIAWLVRNARQQGKAVGFNGIFGAVGISGAGVITGALIDFAGWRAAFIVPGVVAVASGLAFIVLARLGLVAEGIATGRATAATSRRDMLRGFVILVFTMLVSGLVFQAVQAAMPKLFEERLAGLAGGGTLGIGSLVALVYAVGGVVQYFGGHLADRYPPKLVYVLCYLAQVPILLVMTQTAGMPLIAAAMAVVVIGTGLLPAENIMLTRFTPERHRGLAFGLKYVVAFGTGPLALLLVSRITAATGDFYWLLLVLAALALAVFLAALALPGERRAVPLVTPAAAE